MSKNKVIINLVVLLLLTFISKILINTIYPNALMINALYMTIYLLIIVIWLKISNLKSRFFPRYLSLSNFIYSIVIIIILLITLFYNNHFYLRFINIVLVALYDEYIFRGLLFSLLSQNLSKNKVYIASIIIYMLFSLCYITSLNSIDYLFINLFINMVFGFFLTFTRNYANNIYAPFMLHILCLIIISPFY